VEKGVERPLPWRRLPWEGAVPDAPGKPANEVNWEYANLFCDDLNAREEKENRLPDGWHYSLPTAAEWEYACRAGTTTRFSFGDDDGDLDRYGWTDNRGNNVQGDVPRDVALKLPNQWGLFDMHGNVTEWTLDVGSIIRPVLPGGVNPWSKVQKMEVQTMFIQKGGSWSSKGRYCRSASMRTEYSSHSYPSDGFRIVMRQDTSLKR
jgi:formylglycine-generating enzyme required for sulfatase activity